MLAMVGCGKFASVQEAADKLVEVASTTEPDAALTARYEARYQNFKKLYPALKDFFAAMVYNSNESSASTHIRAPWMPGCLRGRS